MTMTEGQALVARNQTLDGFVSEHGCNEGVAISSLEPGTLLTVETRNSRYHLIVLDGEAQRALVSGGTMFPVRTEVVVRGSTIGGTAIKLGWIGVGLRMELTIGKRRVTTTRVQAITVGALLDESLPLIA